MPLQAMQVLNNRYRIVRALKAGGFGTIYRAWDMNLNKSCAVKENLDNTPDTQRQFQREAQMLACLSHPNLPRVFDHFILPQGQYLIMDFIEGEDVDTLRMNQGGAVPEAQVMPWIRQVCDALEYLHSQTPPVIHRDIKPANIRITPEGKAVLVDFGAAKQHSSGSLTTKAAKVISPGYSPPEQYSGKGTDERSDIYALGSTLYTLLTGVELPESIDPQFLRNGVQAPDLIKPSISPHVSQAILHAIDIQPDNRFQNLAGFKQALVTPGRSKPPTGQTVVLPIEPPTSPGGQPHPMMAPPRPVSYPPPPYTPPSSPPPVIPPRRNRTAVLVVLILAALCLCGCALAAIYLYNNGDQIINSLSSTSLILPLIEQL